MGLVDVFVQADTDIIQQLENVNIGVMIDKIKTLLKRNKSLIKDNFILFMGLF